MQQLSFLEPPLQDAVRVWDTLDEEQRARLVLRLARLIANATDPTPGGGHDDERDE